MLNLIGTARIWAFSARGRTWLVAFALLLPRLVRMLYGELWIEDEAYLDIALRISRGQIPYLDFPLPHYCLLDALLGALFRLFGPSLRLAEVLNNAAWWLSAFLLYQTFRRGGREADRHGQDAHATVIGLLAAVLLSVSSLSFRYHLWEREVFSQLVHVVALFFLLTRSREQRRLGLLSLLMVLSALIKLTNLIFWLAVGLYFIVAERDWKAALRLWLPAGVGIGLIFAATSALAWPEFFQQVFLLHWLKGSSAGLLEKLSQAARWLDLLMALGLPGFFCLWRIERRWGLLTLLWSGCTAAFYLFFSPTLWPHNLIDLLIPLALCSAATLWFIGDTLRELKKNPVFNLRGLALIATVIWVGGSLKGLAPFQPSPRHRGAVYGFGFQSRREVAEVGRVIQRWSRPEERIIAPALIAVAANREKLIAYREIAGEAEAIRQRWAEGDRAGVFSRREMRGFFEQIKEEARPWQVEAAEAVKARRVAVVVIDKSRGHYPYFTIPADFLRAYNYQVVLRTENYDLWSPAALR